MPSSLVRRINIGREYIVRKCLQRHGELPAHDVDRNERMLRLTREQIRSVDRLAVERYRMPGIVLMENAARAVADAASRMVPAGSKIVAICGGGNNGGDGLAAARHLHNRGYRLTIALTVDRSKYNG